MLKEENIRQTIMSDPDKTPVRAWTTVGVIVVTMILLLTEPRQLHSAQEYEKSGHGQSSVPAEDLPLKWLPDQRVLAGAPETTLDLRGTIARLCAEGRLGTGASPDDVELSVFSGNADFAELLFDDQQLKIAWKPGVTGKSTVVLKASNEADEETHAYLSFKAESWSPDYLAIFMAVLGGGGLFLLGMRRTSEGLQALAGQKLHKMIQLFTGRPILGLGVGVVVTALIQSSTATSVMTLGFINGGLMTLSQAIGVLMGANIGTTTTGWLLTLHIGALGLPTLGIAALFYLFSKNARIHRLSLLFLGFGMIFFGLETLKSGLAPLPDTPQFSALMNMFRADSGWGAAMCVVVGILMTVIAHSSDATLGLTITLASLGAIDLNSAAAIVLGSNIGTSLTPLLVAIGAPAVTRRAAYFHVLFNTVGVLWVMAIFFPVVIPTINALGSFFGFDVPGRVALTHTLFNVTNTCLFLPFTTPIARFLEKFVADNHETGSLSRTGLNEFIASAPQTALGQSRLTVQRMFLYCEELFEDFKDLLSDNFNDEVKRQRAFEIEKLLDDYQDETISFVVKLMSGDSACNVASSGTLQITVAEEIESISDYVVSVLKSNLKLMENGEEIPEQIVRMNLEHLQYARESLEWLSLKFNAGKRENFVSEMTLRRDKYVFRAKEQRAICLARLANNADDALQNKNPLVIVAIDNQLHAWRRVYAHMLNIAEAMLPDDEEKFKIRRLPLSSKTPDVNFDNPA